MIKFLNMQKFDEDAIEVSNLVKKIMKEDFSTYILVSLMAENICKCDSIVIVL